METTEIRLNFTMAWDGRSWSVGFWCFRVSVVEPVMMIRPFLSSSAAASDAFLVLLKCCETW